MLPPVRLRAVVGAGGEGRGVERRIAVIPVSRAVVWFVPDLVVILTTPPPVWPNSAEKFEVWTVNSWIVSGEKVTMARPNRRRCCSRRRPESPCCRRARR